MVQFLKYVSMRLFIGTFVAVFVVYRLLAWIHESLYAGRSLDDSLLILWLYGGVLLAVSVIMSIWGRLRFRSILNAELERVSRQYHPKVLARAYSRLTGFLTGCYFFNTTRERLSRVVARRFGDILLGMRIEDEEALAIYEEILVAEPENAAYLHFLLRAYSRKPRLSERSWKYLRRRFHERPDDRMVGILSREYTLRGILNFESERVLERCLQAYPEHREKVLGFVVPRLISFQRTDDNAARFYLAALEAGWGVKALPMLERIHERYREKERSDALALAVARAVREAGAQAGRAVGGYLEELTPSLEPRETGDEDFRLEGLVYAPEEELDGRRRESGINLSSRLYQLNQRLFAGGRKAIGIRGRWIKTGTLLILSALLVYLLVNLGQQGGTVFGPGDREGQEKAAQSDEWVQPGGRYTIQVGSFRDSLAASALRDRLAGAGAAARVQTASESGVTVYRVLSGSFTSDSVAVARAQGLAAEGLISDWAVVRVEAGN